MFPLPALLLAIWLFIAAASATELDAITKRDAPYITEDPTSSLMCITESTHTAGHDDMLGGLADDDADSVQRSLQCETDARNSCEVVCSEIESHASRSWRSICEKELKHRQNKIVGGSCKEGVMSAVAPETCTFICLSQLAERMDLVRQSVSIGMDVSCEKQKKLAPAPTTGKACMKGYIAGSELLKAGMAVEQTMLSLCEHMISVSESIQSGEVFQQGAARILRTIESQQKVPEVKETAVEKRRRLKNTPRGMACNACKAG
jgi:hypothetical protein